MNAVAGMAMGRQELFYASSKWMLHKGCRSEAAICIQQLFAGQRRIRPIEAGRPSLRRSTGDSRHGSGLRAA